MKVENKVESIGLFGALGIAFVVLKLIRMLTWSWWFVTMPFWGPPVFLGVVLGVGALLIVSWTFISEFSKSLWKIVRGAAGMSCSTPCDDDCKVWCHENHQPHWKRDHDPAGCPGRCVGVSGYSPPDYEPERCVLVDGHEGPCE